MKDRRRAERVNVQAELLETTQIPPVAVLAEYRRALVVYSYKVRKTLKGNVDSEKILVAHWAYLDRKLLPSIEQKKIGEVYEMELESFDDNPQLESERQFNDSDEFDLSMYYHVGGEHE